MRKALEEEPLAESLRGFIFYDGIIFALCLCIVFLRLFVSDINAFMFDIECLSACCIML